MTLSYTRVPNDPSIVENYGAAIALINPSGRVLFTLFPFPNASTIGVAVTGSSGG